MISTNSSVRQIPCGHWDALKIYFLTHPPPGYPACPEYQFHCKSCNQDLSTEPDFVEPALSFVIVIIFYIVIIINLCGPFGIKNVMILTIRGNGLYLFVKRGIGVPSEKPESTPVWRIQRLVPAECRVRFFIERILYAASQKIPHGNHIVLCVNICRFLKGRTRRGIILPFEFCVFAYVGVTIKFKVIAINNTANTVLFFCLHNFACPLFYFSCCHILRCLFIPGKFIRKCSASAGH